jgi:hypothetical protein
LNSNFSWELRLEYFSEVNLGGLSMAAFKQSGVIRDRALLKDYLEYVNIKQGLLAPYNASYPLVELRELLPSFEKNFSEYKDLPSFSLVVFNRQLSYQEEHFQFDLLHPPGEGRKRAARENLDRIIPHLDRDLRPSFKQRFLNKDITSLAHYEELLKYLFHMDRAQVIARDGNGDFRLLGVYGSFPSDLDNELKAFGCSLGKFKKQDNAKYEKEREFVYQYLMELYGLPIASERRTSAALFARKLSRQKEQYLIKVLGQSDRTITSMSGFDQKMFPLVEKTALVSFPPGLAEAYPHLRAEGYYVDRQRRVVIMKITYQQHKYNRFNVLEDRALSVIRQEIIHPYHGGRDTSVNILKDTKRFLKELTDIVRGEHSGSISYRRSELLTSTKTHEERLKFLSAWLIKNQRRLGTYSQESFEAAKKMLNSYLLNREHREVFAKYPELHKEVVQQLSYVSQAHQLQPLEKLAQRQGAQMPPSRRLEDALHFLEAKKEVLPYFYPDLFDKCVKLWDQILSYPYLKEVAAYEEPPVTSFRRRVWDMLTQGQELIRNLLREHQQIHAEVDKGTPFPLLLGRK